ncbi:CTP synthetase [Only Syngen Nebraska virus 5]|uniref:CTP synthetase n=1 Tax=Only Syngen Nebraska virus 5 TaxID=1917232 RepID=UPI000901A71D|nr:CTP synthetase [Only Syngen Nebraska virus 5]APC25846.1 CTP synthetase [Only Syngen Nebraska virus 5]
MTENKKHKKFMFITGGVSSSLGKGLAAASIASLLERRCLKIAMLKMDPYINVDPGTMSPTQHGEVFVTDDGAETDLDLGHYERFTSLTLKRESNFTTGQVYLKVIENEREGSYLGKTVQVVPHITDEIKRRIHIAAEKSDILIGEIGGTVGDIESLPFIEAIRQLSHDEGTANVLFIHLVLLPYIATAGELKSKPAQHSVKELMSQGLLPHIIISRSDRPVDEDTLDKISRFCNISRKNVFQSIDMDSIYKVPLEFHKQGLDERISELLGFRVPDAKIEDLEKVVYNFTHPLREVKIGIVGKYTDLIESYKSLVEALHHGAIANRLKFKPIYIDSEQLESGERLDELLSHVQGILVPGGFGVRGTKGIIKAIEYARTKKIPFFGICLGMQLAVIEYARHVAGITDATSEEFQSGGTHLIHYMKGQKKEGTKGGTMRLGSYDCSLEEGTLGRKIYQTDTIHERHRHRLEVNNMYIDALTEAHMTFSGFNKELNLVEVIELKDHPFFIACQYHPEFKSKPFSPHPLFKTFIEEADRKNLNTK